MSKYEKNTFAAGGIFVLDESGIPSSIGYLSDEGLTQTTPKEEVAWQVPEKRVFTESQTVTLDLSQQEIAALTLLFMGDLTPLMQRLKLVSVSKANRIGKALK